MAQIDNLELLFSEIDLLKAELQWHSRLQEQAWLQTQAIENTYHSNHLEGSSLSLRETELVIRTGLMLPGKSMAENLAALNHYQAIQFIREQAGEHALLSEELLKQLHALLSKALNRQQAGSYRTQAATLANGQAATPPEDLAGLMADFMRWTRLEGAFLHPIVFAAEILLRLETLQPFPTANGLCARLAMNLILLEEGYPLLNINDDDVGRAAYCQALANAQSDADKNAWFGFIAEQSLRNAQRLFDRVQAQADSLDCLLLGEQKL